MKRLSIVVVLLAAAALGGLSGVPRVASADVVHSKSIEADAYFTSMLDPCTELHTWVAAGAWTDMIPLGPPVQGGGLLVVVDVSDVCTGTPLDFWSGETDAADVKVSPQHASAAGSVEICNLEGDCVSANISVDWDVQNAPTDITPFKRHDPPCKSWGRTQVRAAAATGAVVVEGMNLAPDPAVSADTWAGQGGELCKF